MSKEWYEEDASEFASGFTEERQIHHRQPTEEQLTKTYGPSAPYSEHKRGEHITYTSAEGERRSGEIVWVQAATDAIQMKYVIAPSDGGFLDFCLPGDVITQEEQASDDLTECPYCKGMHPRSQVEHCPLNPRKG